MSKTALRPSLSGMRKICLEPHPARRVTISRKTFVTLLDIAEAAQALDTALLHDAVAGVEAKLTLEELDEALSKVQA